jgi:hypothetical protein
MRKVDIDEMFREASARRIALAAEALDIEVRANASLPERQRAASLTHLVDGEGGGFITLDGSAHRLGGLFERLFSERPELRGVVQDVLDRMYKVDLGYTITR